MASIITATVASGLTQQADNSGVLQLASGTGNLVTIPSVTGTAMVSGNMPAFAAYANAGQNISAATFTKVAINTEYFDSNSCFDSTTNYRFTPTVAGYYQVNGTLSCGTTGATELIVALYKNGSIYSRGTDINLASGSMSDTLIGYNEIVYLNGSTDYIELYGFVSANPRANNGFRYYDTWLTSRFSAAMIRSA